MKVNIQKLHPEAVIPEYAKPGDAGLDLVAISEKVKLEATGPYVEYGTGLVIEIPEGHVGLIFPRSSVTTKTTLTLGNAVGVIDSGYRGEIRFQFRNLAHVAGKKYNVGDRVGQLIIMPYPLIEWNEVEELSETDRGEGGFGSTDVKDEE